MRIGYLVFASNTAYTKVVDEAPEGVKVDLVEGTWLWNSKYKEPLRKIGEKRYLGEGKSGIIGVYDLDDIKQVNSMVHDAVESQRDYSKAN